VLTKRTLVTKLPTNLQPGTSLIFQGEGHQLASGSETGNLRVNIMRPSLWSKTLEKLHLRSRLVPRGSELPR
jgi:hypothetical protein